jgi:uncharacterized phiE125 gp8 family phage protein
MALRCLTPSTVLAVEVDDLKDHLRISSTDDDIVLRGYILSATKQAENKMKRQCCTAQFKFALPEFSIAMEIPRPPLKTTSVSIEYLDVDGATQTLASSLYDVDTYQEPAVIRFNYGATYPETYPVENAVRISFVSGYEKSTVDNLPTVPEDIKLWIMLRAGDMYEHRESIADLSANTPKIFPFVDGLLDPYLTHNTEGW